MGRPMRLTYLALFLGLTGARLTAQTDAHSLEDSLRFHQFTLRNYSADAVVRYVWLNGRLTAGEPRVRSLGKIQVESVAQRGDVVVIVGQRSTLIENADGALPPPRREPTTIEVDLRGADAKIVLPQLTAQMFFPDDATALAGLPAQYAESLPYRLTGRPECCASSTHVFANGGWKKMPVQGDAHCRPAKLTFAPEPEFSEEARHKRVNGSVTLLITVSERGKVTDVWIASSLGLGLDQKSIEAARQYRFEPATCEGVAVQSEMAIEVNFQFF